MGRAYAAEWGGTIVHSTAEFEREARGVAARDLMNEQWGGKAAEIVAQVDKWNVLKGSDKKNGVGLGQGIDSPGG
jgi:hypothetical protein